jgi:transposase
MSDLTLQNQRALQFNPWRENLQSLRETAVRLDAIVTCGFSRRKAAESLGLVRQTFYHWFSNTMRLSKPLVPEARKRAMAAALAARTPPT